MTDSVIHIGLAFIEGFALILSPCVLPILPIILAGSLTGSKKRPLGIIIGFILTFAVFSYFAHTLVHYLGIDLTVVRHGAYILLLLFGITLLSTHLTEWFNHWASKITSIGPSALGQKSKGFLSGLFLGSLVSILWTPCAGPILAAVIVQIVIQQETIMSFLILLAFALGAAIPMLISAFYSVQIRDGFLFFKAHALLFRKTLGVIILLNVAYMVAQESGYGSLVTVSDQGIRTSNYLRDGLWRPYPAPEISGINTWINSPPLVLSQLKGKVVLVDFWTYSCINCIRTLPYLNYWYQQYHHKGLVIIGIHAPEFDFEKNATNVTNAVHQYALKYPIALDNQFSTWRNFSNHYWPAHYLINKQGKVVYEHIGEGKYDSTENNIRFLLGEDYTAKTAQLGAEHHSYLLTPETYLGYERAQSNANQTLVHDTLSNYSYPRKLDLNQWALQGAFISEADKIRSSQSDATLAIHFQAKNVYIVMGTHSKKANTVIVRLNPTSTTQALGKEAPYSTITVSNYSLYHVLSLPKKNQGILQITATEPGLEIYTVTFGN
jgi:cytochrome c biogenesis protein CcdA/thiol-disulfide isomerase/thioredoxin